MSAAIYFAEACRLYVLMVMLTAAGSKIMDFVRFRSSLAEAFPVLATRTGSGATIAATAVVAGEWSAASMMLLGGLPSRFGIMMALCLLSSLTAVVAVSMLQGRSIRCNCFGESDRRVSKYDLMRNLLFIAIATVGLIGASSNGPPGTLGGLALQSYLPLAAAVGLVFLLSINIHDIAALFDARMDEL